jgi:hypothetical protein
MAIKFEIFRDGHKLSAFNPVAAMAVGPESVPMPGEVHFDHGTLVLDRPDDAASGVGLLWDMGPLGSYHLETTRVPPRSKPYNLNVELARFRLMKIVQKQEDWNLFDFPKSEKFQQTFRDAQNLFAEALGKLDKPAEAAALADKSHQIAVELSDELQGFHRELLITRRKSANAFVRHIFGCRVDSQVRNQKYRDTLAGNFDYAVLPMSWKQLQPQEQVFNTEALDDWVELLNARRLPIIAGPLIDLTDVPDWMFIWEHDFDTLRELAYEYVQKVI